MPENLQNQFQAASAQQAKGWMEHDIELLGGGAEVINGQITPSNEQQEQMRQDMAADLAGRTAIKDTVSAVDVETAGDEGEVVQSNRKEVIGSIALGAIRKVIKPGRESSLESIRKAYRSGSILPEGADGEIAFQVASTFLDRLKDGITEDQKKWFTLGVATQANATNEFSSRSDTKS